MSNDTCSSNGVRCELVFSTVSDETIFTIAMKHSMLVLQAYGSTLHPEPAKYNEKLQQLEGRSNFQPSKQPYDIQALYKSPTLSE
jgi:hypothetical protein